MRHFFLAALAALWVGSASLFACTGDDVDGDDASADAGKSDAAHDATTDTAPTSDGALLPDAQPDASADADAAAPKTPYLLMSYAYDNYSKTEYSAFNLTTGTVDGNLQYAMYGWNMSGGIHPWALEQFSDVVLEMDAVEPWKTKSSWNVALPPANDAGKPNANPWSVAETSTKAYLAFYNRNTIAVLDTSAAVDGGVPAKLIDISGLHQSGDSDGYVEATAAVYVPTHNRIYVVLGNVDLNDVDPQGYFLLCGTSHAVVVAIDSTTDALVNFDDGGALGNAIPLHGVSPSPGGLVYDAAGDRLLILSSGCNQKVADDAGPDAGPGALTGRGIEQVSLVDNTTKVLLDAPAQGFPGLFAYGDAHHAWVQFGSVTQAWDPTTTTLGAVVSAAPDAFVYDGKGALLGPKSTYLADGGFGGISVISVPTDGDAGVTTIGASPVSTPDPGGYFEAIGLWNR